MSRKPFSRHFRTLIVLGAFCVEFVRVVAVSLRDRIGPIDDHHKPTFADLFALVLAVAFSLAMTVACMKVYPVCHNGYRASIASFGYVECEAGR